MSSRSMFQYRVGGSTYSLFTEPRCKVCKSANRYEIENAVVHGAGFKGAADEFGDGTISARNVRSHIERGHIPLAEAAIEKVKKQKALDYEEMIEEYCRRFGAVYVGSKTVIRAAERGLRDGEIRPTMHEAIQAGKLITRAEEQASRSRNLSLQDMARRVLDMAERELSAEAMSGFRGAILGDSILSELFQGA